MRLSILLLLCLTMVLPLYQGQQTASSETVYLLKPAHVFDGESAQVHDNWVVVVRGEEIEADTNNLVARSELAIGLLFGPCVNF